MNSEITEITEIKEERSQRNDHVRPASASETARRRDETLVPQTNHSFRGWILYDGACPSCTASARRFDRIFHRRGFLFLPLQTNWVMQRLDLKPGAPLEEIRVLTADGRDIGGANAVIFLARQIWWAHPFAALARLPGMHKLLDRGYRWIAAHRGCDHIGCDPGERRLLSEPSALPSQRPSRRRRRTAVWRQPLLEATLESVPGWILPIVLPISVLLVRDRVAPWQFMWVMASAIFLGCKWLTAWRALKRFPEPKLSRTLGYFLGWPGMDAEKFLRRPNQNLMALSHQVVDRPALIFAIVKMFGGAVLLFGVARFAYQPLLAGWIGMIGMILILHFGAFQLLAFAWQVAGVDAKPIMDAPLRSKSVSEFWGRRWNAAFNRLALDFVFRPLAGRLGGRSSSDAAKRSRGSSTLHRRGRTKIATLAAFLASGLIHELVTSLPAGAGYGLPTVYFLLQGIGLLTERALPQIRSRIFTVVITAGPAFFLFHPPFVRNVILPFMKAIGAL